jgi:hypothetical protein
MMAAKPTCKEALRRVMMELEGGPADAEDIFRRTRQLGPWTDDTIWQHLMALTVNLPPAYRHWPHVKERILFLREDGMYELYDPQKHGLFRFGRRVKDI